MPNQTQRNQPVMNVVMATPPMDAQGWLLESRLAAPPGTTRRTEQRDNVASSGSDDTRTQMAVHKAIQAAQSFTLIQTKGIDPVVEIASKTARTAGYTLRCYFIGTSNPLVNASRATRDQSMDPMRAVDRWYRLREELAGTAAKYRRVELIRNDSDRYVSTHVFKHGVVISTAPDRKRTPADDELALQVHWTLESAARSREKKSTAPSPKTEPARPITDETSDAQVYQQRLLQSEPAANEALWPLLRYVEDVMAAVNWLDGRNKLQPVGMGLRQHLLDVGTEFGRRTATVIHPRTETDGPGATDTYIEEKKDELLRDMVTHVTKGIQTRSGWATVSDEPARPEELRVALAGRGLEGYYMHCPLDSEGKPWWAVSTLRRTNEEPDADESTDVPLNAYADNLIEQLMHATTKRTAKRGYWERV